MATEGPMGEDRIRFCCSGCQQQLATEASQAGRRVACPTCRRVLIVPSATVRYVEPIVDVAPPAPKVPPRAAPPPRPAPPDEPLLEALLADEDEAAPADDPLGFLAADSQGVNDARLRSAGIPPASHAQPPLHARASPTAPAVPSGNVPPGIARSDWRRGIPPAKRAMLIATILWPVLTVLLGVSAYVTEYNKWEVNGPYMLIRHTTGGVVYNVEIVTTGEFEARVLGEAVGVAFLVTVLYGVAMVILIVFWFATKDTEKRNP